MENIQYEASPDVQIYLKLVRNNVVIDELEANINISKTTYELKKSLSEPLQISVENMELWKNNVQLQDNVQLTVYEIAYNDVLVIKDTAQGNTNTA